MMNKGQSQRTYNLIDISVFSCLSNVCEVILAIKITYEKPLILSKVKSYMLAVNLSFRC